VKSLLRGGFSIDSRSRRGLLGHQLGINFSARRRGCWAGAIKDCVLGLAERHTSSMADALTLTAVFTPDENGWTMAQLAEWPAVVTCGRTVEEARTMLLDAAREMIASYRDEGREPPIGGGHVEAITIDLAA
jgi:predicted RNase H-like HicB family nuclease